MKKLRVGAIGLGRMGYLHAENMAFRIGNAELAAVCDLNAERAKEAAQKLQVPSWYAGYEEMFEKEDLDAVMINNTAAAHCVTIQAACERGLHIFCEKPTGITMEELDLIDQAIARNPGRIFQVGFARRFDQSYMIAREKVKNGDIGKIIKIQSVNRDPADMRAEYSRFGAGSGGMFYDQMVHDFDLIRWITGAEVESVYTLGGIYGFEEFKNFNDIDNTVITMTLSDGSVAVAEGSKNSTCGFNVWMEIMGTEGSLRIGPGCIGSVEIGDGHGLRKEVNRWVLDRFCNAYLEEMNAFVRLALGEDGQLVTAEDARASVQIAAMCEKSFRSGAVVCKHASGAAQK